MRFAFILRGSVDESRYMNASADNIPIIWLVLMAIPYVGSGLTLVGAVYLYFNKRFLSVPFIIILCCSPAVLWLVGFFFFMVDRGGTRSALFTAFSVIALYESLQYITMICAFGIFLLCIGKLKKITVVDSPIFKIFVISTLLALYIWLYFSFWQKSPEVPPFPAWLKYFVG